MRGGGWTLIRPGRRRALVALVAALIALGGCGQAAPTEPPEPTATPAPPTATPGPPTPTSVPPATLPPLTPGLGPAKGIVVAPTPSAPAAGAAEAQALVDRALSGQDRADLTNLLRAAALTGDEEQRYRAYVGAWQYARDIYFQKGQRPEQRALLDALQSVGQSFPQYRPDDFALDASASR